MADDRGTKRKRDDDPKPWHRNIRLANPNEVRVDKDQYGNLIIKNKTGNGITRDNIALLDPGTSSDGSQVAPRRILGTFDHTQGAISLGHYISNHWESGTKFSVLFVEQNQGQVVAPPEASPFTLPMLPYMNDSAFSFPRPGVFSADAEKCANCGRFGHRLIDCCLPNDLHGDIYGCPVCNTRAHGFDSCPNLEFLTASAKFSILCHRRGGKPLIRSDYDVYEAARLLHQKKPLPNTFVFPWTREGTIKILRASRKHLETIDYTGDKARAGQAIDCYATFETVILSDTPPNSSFSYWKKMSKAFKHAGPNINATASPIRPNPGPPAS